jgi:pilus retraction protein PilT
VSAAVVGPIADAVPAAIADAARHAVENVAAAAVTQAARETVAHVAPAAVSAAVVGAVADAVPAAVAAAARHAVDNVAAAAVAQAARHTVAESVPAAVAAALASAVPGAVADAARHAVDNVAVAAVARAARETVAETAPGVIAEAARAAASAAATVAVTAAAREIVADVASAAVTSAVPGAVVDAARTATGSVAVPAVEKAARERVAEVVPSVVAQVVPLVVADEARMAVNAAVAAAVAHAAHDVVARVAPAAVVEAARTAVNEGVAAALTNAARETVADAAPAEVVAAVSAAVANAVPAAVADAARAAVADVAPAAVAKAVAAALAAAAAATGAQVVSGDLVAPAPYGERSSSPQPGAMPPVESVKPPSAAVLEFAPSRLSPPRASTPEVSFEAASTRVSDTRSDWERLLRAAAARRTSTLYLFSNARPSATVDDQLQTMDGEPVLSASDVFALLLTMMPETNREALRMGTATEWNRDVEGIGRVRCMSFSDYRGPGAVFQMPVPAPTADQLGLTPEIQSLAQYPEGLVLVAGSQSSGKQMLMSALVDRINRSRQGYIISLEEAVTVVHGSGRSVISQRQVQWSEDEVLDAIRSALRESPSVLMLEDIRTGATMNAALEAASSGHLVIGGIRANSASEAVERIVSFYAPEHSRQVRLALAENLRGIVAQVLLADRRGGKIAAREVVKTPDIAAFVAGGTMPSSSASEEGRSYGMVRLADVLAEYVQQGVVDLDEACRHVRDRSAFLTLLKRRGVDVERPAQSRTSRT